MKRKQKAMMTVLALVACSGICSADHFRPESRSLNSNSRINAPTGSVNRVVLQLDTWG